MNLTYVSMLVVLVATCVGLGCGKPPSPPKPPRDSEIVYNDGGGKGLAKYVLSPAERNVMMDILLSNPTETFVNNPLTLSSPWGTLRVAGRYRYGVDYEQISVWFKQGSKESGYVWRSDRITALGKRLYEATTNRDIQDAFAAFAVQQGPATGE